MKLSILYESRNPKQPTDLSLVATQSTKDGAARGKYPVNFYSGKIGYKSSGKVVLGYHDKDEKFKTTGPIVGIVQSKKAPDRWLIKTINDSRPAYYSIQMPEATVMSTYNRYLTLNQSTPIPIYTYDQNTKKHINKKDTRRRDNEGWSYYNGTTISKSNMPTRKPKTSVEAYDYLMYWAYHNNQLQSAADAISHDQLIEFLSYGKRLSKSIRDIVAAFPNAKEAVIKRLNLLKEELYGLDREFELNLDDDSGVARDEWPEPEQTPKPTQEPTPKPTPELDPHLEPEPREPGQSGSDAGHDLDMDYGLDKTEPAQDTSTDEASALDQDTHRDQDTDSGSVEMPASNTQQKAPEEASPEVVALNSKKFIKLLTNLLDMDPEEAPKRLRKVISQFLELRHEPASWGKCFVDDQDSDLVLCLEDYDRLCKVKAFWAGDNRKSNERRELEWSQMDQMMKAYVGGLQNTIDSQLAGSYKSLKTALKQLIDKIRKIDPSVL